MNETQKLRIALLSAALLGLAATGCSRQEAPSTTQADVSNAQAEGAKNVEEERHAAAKDSMSAQEGVHEAQADLAHESAEGNRNVMVAQAEAAHEVSIESCEAMNGDARDACKKQADVDLYDAKAKADQVSRAADPKR